MINNNIFMIPTRMVVNYSIPRAEMPGLESRPAAKEFYIFQIFIFDIMHIIRVPIENFYQGANLKQKRCILP